MPGQPGQARMIELDLHARAGGFHLQAACRLTAPLTVVFGPSGAGKSTLLRILAGLARPDRGRVSLHGRLLTDTTGRIHLPPGKRGMTLAGQRASLFPQMSVARNVAFGLQSLSATDRQQRIAESLALVGAEALTDRRTSTLSGGEAQRVALARALAPRPELLLLDEPLSALDTAARDRAMTAMLDWLGSHGIQTILVTHDAADALRTQAEVIRMQEGRIVAQGPAMEVLDEERRRLLARLQQG